jgi:F420 biosynthesis protein FbiB-like protein
MSEGLHTFLRSRRSIRRFKSDPIPNEMIQRILETANYAPSAHNMKPWRFVILTARKIKLLLAKAITGKYEQDMITDGIPDIDIRTRVNWTIRFTIQAPVIVILCRDKKLIKNQPDTVRNRAEEVMGVQSVALAGLQLLLAAHAEGLGGTWICWPLFAQAEIHHTLRLNPDWEPDGMIFLGYPAEIPEMQKTRSFKEVALFL